MPELHTTTYGESGPLVAFCHGLFGQGRNWTQVAKALAGDHRVLTIDMPQHGRSLWSDTVDYLAMADQVAELFNPEETVALVGHSMGGKIAMALALRHPELVERLCVVDVSPVGYERMSDSAAYARAMLAMDLDTLESRGQAEERLAAEVTDPVVRGFLLQNLRRGQDDRGRPGWHWQMNLAVLAEQLPVLMGWPEDRLRDVAPYPGATLWVAGEHSDYVLPGHEAAMHDWFPRARRLTVKGAGHWVHSEQPETFLAVLQRFLTG